MRLISIGKELMKMEKQIINQLKMLADGKNNTYAAIAAYLLKIEGIEEIENLKIKQLKSACHVSSTTIIRFCKEVGLSGFSELKYRLSQNMKDNDKIVIRDNYGLSERANEHLNNITTSFIETRDLLTDEKLESVINLIYKAQLINIYAVGSTYLVARDLELKLDRVGKFCKSYNDKNLQYFAAKNSTDRTVAMGISYSGETESVIESLKISREQQAKTILLTNKRNDYFEEIFDIVIYVSATDMRNRLITTTSRLTLLYVVDLIYYSYINMNNSEVNNVLKHNSYM